MSSSEMSTASSSSPTGWRILGFGRHPDVAAAIQAKLRSLGFQATNFVLTNDDAGDAGLVAELKRRFSTVKHAKPPASRKGSSEWYVVAQGFKASAAAPAGASELEDQGDLGA